MLRSNFHIHDARRTHNYLDKALITLGQKAILRVIFSGFVFLYILNALGLGDGRINLFGNSKPSNLRDFQEIFTALGGPIKLGDGGWHLRVASELVSQNFVNTESLWWLTSAPPGVAVVEALVIKLVGFESFGIFYCILIAFLWTTAFLLFFGSASTVKRLVLNILAFLTLFNFTGFSQWMIGPGIFFTEALSTPFLIISIALLIKSRNSSNPSLVSLYLGLSAISLASASFVRANFLYISYTFALLGILLYLRKFGIQHLKVKSKKFSKEADPGANFLMYGFGSLVALFPYFVMAYDYLKMPPAALNSSGFHLQYAWINPNNDPFRSIGAGWLCEINRKYCQNGFEAVTQPGKLLRQHFETFLQFPIDVLTSRADVFIRAWFSGEGPGATGSYDAKFQGILLLVFLLCLIFMSIYAKDSNNRSESRYFMIFATALLVPYAITHLEVRYMIPIKLLILLFVTRFSLQFLYDFPVKKKLHVLLSRVDDSEKI